MFRLSVIPALLILLVVSCKTTNVSELKTDFYVSTDEHLYWAVTNDENKEIVCRVKCPELKNHQEMNPDERTWLTAHDYRDFCIQEAKKHDDRKLQSVRPIYPHAMQMAKAENMCFFML